MAAAGVEEELDEPNGIYPVVHYQMGELAEAVTLLHEAVTGYRRVLGEEHPETRRAVENLRVWSQKMEDDLA